jgi:glucose/arabinose dehydrogenase
LLSDPFLTLPANSYIQRGLLGLALDPDFATNGYVYLYYTREHDASDPAGPKTGRLIRVTASGDTALPGSEVTLLGTVGADDTHDSCSTTRPGGLPAAEGCRISAVP